MPSLKRMKKMNYAEAWEFFMKEERMGVPRGNGLSEIYFT